MALHLLSGQYNSYKYCLLCTYSVCYALIIIIKLPLICVFISVNHPFTLLLSIAVHNELCSPSACLSHGGVVASCRGAVASCRAMPLHAARCRSVSRRAAASCRALSHIVASVQSLLCRSSARLGAACRSLSRQSSRFMSHFGSSWRTMSHFFASIQSLHVALLLPHTVAPCCVAAALCRTMLHCCRTLSRRVELLSHFVAPCCAMSPVSFQPRSMYHHAATYNLD